MKEDEEELGCGSHCSHSCQGCGVDHGSEEELEMEDLEEGVITFTDEDGNDVAFQILDSLTVDDKSYLVVMPCEEEDEENIGVVILEINEEDGEEVYDTVVDEAIAQKVFEEFKKTNEIDE